VRALAPPAETSKARWVLRGEVDGYQMDLSMRLPLEHLLEGYEGPYLSWGRRFHAQRPAATRRFSAERRNFGRRIHADNETST
jgi:hypothetical protein